MLAKIDGKVLILRNGFRPAKRYLYFAFASTLLRRQRHNVEGWWHEFADYATKEI